MLRAQSWIYETAHWQVKGDDSYANHLLLERIYESLGDQIDGLAERIVGYIGTAPLDVRTTIDETKSYIDKWGKKKDLLARCLATEKEFQKACQEFVDTNPPLALEDFVGGLAGDHDPNVYLLQQALGKSKRLNEAVMPGPGEGPVPAPAVPGAETAAKTELRRTTGKVQPRDVPPEIAGTGPGAPETASPEAKKAAEGPEKVGAAERERSAAERLVAQQKAKQQGETDEEQIAQDITKVSTQGGDKLAAALETLAQQLRAGR
jgi:DNA-binding ferritin-like protein